MSAQGSLQRAIAQFRAAAFRNDGEAAGAIVRAYAHVWSVVSKDIVVLAQRIQAAQDAGEDVNAAWLARDARYHMLRSQIELQIARFADVAGSNITEAQRKAVEISLSHTFGLTLAAAGPAPRGARMPWAHLPISAMHDLIGALTDGSPLSERLAQFGPQAGEAMRGALLEGLALGRNPNAMVQSIRQEIGGFGFQALTIQRTETMRALRTASSREYERNRDVLDGWYWECDTGACAACLAMDGRWFPVTDSLDSHPRCRCVEVPQTKSWEQLGFRGVPDRRLRPDEPGEKWARLSEAQQLDRVGPAKFQAIQDGRIDLTDLVQETYSKQWGSGRREASLQTALEQHARAA